MTNLPASIPTDRVSPLAGSLFAAPPPAPTPILGREDDLSRAHALVFDAPGRLITLTGPGGVGKTRLALALAESLRTDFPDGLAFVDLTPLTDPALVSPAIATALAFRGAPEERLPSALAGLLRDRRTLLVLDNCEHVLSGVAPTVDALLAAAPDLVVLATSREPLRLRREQIVPVDPLPVPNGAGRSTPADVATLPSVALFVSRARAADPRFALTEENTASVARLVTALDGLPLAIELAAARAGSLGPAALAARAEHLLGLLRWDGADLPTRQRSLRATLDWSYGLLPEPEQAVFRRLGAFAGSFGLDAAAAVVDADGLGLDALDVLAGLADKGLVRSLGAGPDGPRFTLLETVREYARQRLGEQGEADVTARRLVEHLLAKVERTDLGPGAAQRDGLARLEADLDNLRAALGWAANHEEYEIGLRLATGKGMWLFWLWRGHLVEGGRWLQTFLAGDDLPRSLYAEGLLALAELVQYRGDVERAEGLWQSVRDAGCELGDARFLGWGTGNLGVVAQLRGDHERAAALTREALGIHTEMGDDWGAAWAHLFLGITARNRGDLAGARRELEASAAGFARLDDDGGLARPLAELGRVSLAEGQPGDAVRLIERALRLSTGDAPSLWNVVYVVEAAVALAAAIHPERTARLLGGLDALRSAMGLSRTPDERIDAEQAERAAWAALGDVAMTAEREAGSRILPGDLVAEALAVVTAPPTMRVAAQPAAPPNPLSNREQEVLALVAEGLTSAQIAERLFFAEPTVKFHVRSILNKLGVSTRAQAVAEAARRGLL